LWSTSHWPRIASFFLGCKSVENNLKNELDSTKNAKYYKKILTAFGAVEKVAVMRREERASEA
jgi:hypothetical protein